MRTARGLKRSRRRVARELMKELANDPDLGETEIGDEARRIDRMLGDEEITKR